MVSSSSFVLVPRLELRTGALPATLLAWAVQRRFMELQAVLPLLSPRWSQGASIGFCRKGTSVCKLRLGWYHFGNELYALGIFADLLGSTIS